MKFRPFSLLLFWWMTGCSQMPEPCDELISVTSSRGVKSFKPLLYLNETGCIACGRRFAHLCETYLSTSDVQIVLKATGTQLDLSVFIKPGQNRVQWDDDNKFSDCLGLRGSSAVFFNGNGGVDTIVTINASTLNQDFDYIISRLPPR